MKKMSMSRRFSGEAGFAHLPRRKALVITVFALLAFVPQITAQATVTNVLILSGGRGRVSIGQMESSLRAHFPEPVNFSIVDLDNPRFTQKAYQDNLAEALRAAYSSEKPDLLFTVSSDSLEFGVQYRDKMFPGVPLVFMSVSTTLPEKIWPGVTGVVSSTGITETINLALRLQPETRTVAIIARGENTDGDWLQDEHSELLQHHDKVEEVDFIGPATPDLLQKVAGLPAHTVVLFQLYPQDSNQPAFGALDVLAAVAQRFPTYSIAPQVILDRGGIGGASYDPTQDAVLAGQLAARVLSGERPENIPVVHNSNLFSAVDWRQLHRWNIPESALPPGTRVLYREPTLWEQGRKYFLAGIAVIVVQSLLIFGLFWQRAQRRKADAQRRKAEVERLRSEEKFVKAFRQSPLAITIVRASDGRYVDVNETFELLTGLNRDEIIGRTAFETGHWVNADQKTGLLKELLEKGNMRDLEVKIRRKDGQIRTSLGSAELIEVNGELCALSVFADITERKRAEEAMSNFSQRLIEAQEAERTRIARELHDDINQRLAMVAVGLKILKQDFSHSEPKTIRHIDTTCEQVSALESDIQALSHHLHSSKLEYLGLEAAIASFCRELSERHNIKIDLHSDGVPDDLSNEVSLCLFRVLQEALHNAVKYSGVDNLEVSLTGGSHEIQLRVHDSGAGFDPRTVRDGHGLGLTSMKERLKLVGGELSIQSKPQEGTTVSARVPIGQGTTTARATPDVSTAA